MNIETLKELYNQGDLTEEALKKYERDGMINSDELLGIIMTDRKIIELFNPETKKEDGIPKWFFAPSDGRYNIYLDGTRHRKSNKEDFDKILLEWYRKKFISDKTVKHYFDVFCEKKKDDGEANSENTIVIYLKDFEKYLTPIADRNIDSISETELKSILTTIVKTETKNGSGLTMKKFLAVYAMVMGIFEVAWLDHVIKEEPRISVKSFRKYCRKTKRKSDSERVADKSQIDRVNTKIEQTLDKNPLNMTAYAYKLILLTGMRAAEVCGLKWSDIIIFEGNEVIEVQREYVYQRISKTHIIEEHTKTHKERLIPITPAIQELFNTVKSVKAINGIDSEFVFGTDKLVKPSQLWNFGRDRTYDRKPSEGKNVHVNPHKIRRTVNSNMKNMAGADSKTTSAILGNSEKVNNDCYSYDTSNMSYKKSVLEEAQKIFLS